MENHHITIDNRQRITITQVADVDAFDEGALWANLKEGGIELTGQELNIEKLDLDQGVLVVTGQVESLTYTGGAKPLKKRFAASLGRGRK